MSTIVGSASVRITPDLTGFHAKIKAATATVRDVKVNVDADTAGATAQIAAFKGMNSAASAAQDAVAALGETITPLGATAAVAATALIPLTAALGGVVVALSAPIGAAALGGGLFAFIAGRMIGKTNKVIAQIETLRKRADSLTNPKAAARARAQAKELEASLTGPQKAFLNARLALSAAFSKLTTGATGNAVIAPIAAGMKLLAQILPQTKPLIIAVSGALTDLIGKLSANVGNGGFSRFIGELSKLAGPSIRKIGSILGSVGSSIHSVLKAATPTGAKALTAIANGARDLSKYLKSPAGQAKLQAFFTWVQKNGPGIAKSLASIAKSSAQFAKDMAPLGSVVVKVADALSKFYRIARKIPGVTGLFNFGNATKRLFSPKILTDLKSLGDASAKIRGGKSLSIKVPNLGAAVKQVGALGKAARDLPPTTNVKIKQNSLASPISQLKDLNAELAKLKSKDITITTTYKTNGSAPATATGGVFGSAQRRLIAEAGPEAVVPLNRPLSAVDKSVRGLSAIAQGKAVSALAVRGGSPSGDRPILMPDGTLFGWIRDIAEGITELHVNQQMQFSGQLDRMYI